MEVDADEQEFDDSMEYESSVEYDDSIGLDVGGHFIR